MLIDSNYQLAIVYTIDLAISPYLILLSPCQIRGVKFSHEIQTRLYMEKVSFHLIYIGIDRFV